MLDVCALPLKSGGHSSVDDGMCVMEMVSYLAREKWSDSPKCASPVIASFLRSWNDSLNDDDRQMLKPYAFKVIGTNTGKADDLARSWMALDWLCRVHTPAWLRLAGLTKEAQAIEATARIVDAQTAELAQPALNEGRRVSDAAWDAARAAARDAARAAARDAAWAAAWAAAGDAAWDAARAAAWDAAWAAARDAAWAAAGVAAGVAAWDAARAAAAAAEDAAGAAALRPHVEMLQTSAVDLFYRMIALDQAA